MDVLCRPWCRDPLAMLGFSKLPLFNAAYPHYEEVITRLDAAHRTFLDLISEGGSDCNFVTWLDSIVHKPSVVATYVNSKSDTRESVRIRLT
jgi:hypothetical protein